MPDHNTAPVGVLLRQWRQRRHLSQLELSSRAEVSTRHLSYIETGRSHPTPHMVEKLAHHLEVPLRERNQLMLSAGFAPPHPERGLDDPELFAVSNALRTILDAHLPFPALMLDRWWNVVDRNTATDLLLIGCAAHLLEPPINAVRLTLHPDGLAPRISNLDQWRAHMIGQVRSRADRTGDELLRGLADEAACYPGADIVPPARTDVVVPLQLVVDGQQLSFFSVSSLIESAADVTVDELRIEAFYPADHSTRQHISATG